jgi:tetratricopeptide (TPR) repeat protein
MTMRSTVARPARFFALAILVAACGGPPPAKNPEPDPPLDDEPGAVEGPAVEPSSAKVKQGMDAIQTGDFEAAKTLLSEAVDETPNDPQAAFYLGVALESLEDLEGAAASYEKAVELDPRLVEARINLSGVLLDSGDATRALQVADGGLKVEPKNAPLLLNRAAALDVQGNEKEAVSAYAAAVEAAPNNARAHYLFAEVLAKSGKEDRAKAELAKAAKSDEIDVLASTGRLFGRLKAFDDCVAALDRAIEKEKLAELIVQRGVCRHGKKDDAGAKADYEAAIATDPKFAPAQFYLGQHLKTTGDKKGAKKALEKAVELDPDGGVGKAAKKALKEL